MPDEKGFSLSWTAIIIGIIVCLLVVFFIYFYRHVANLNENDQRTASHLSNVDNMTKALANGRQQFAGEVSKTILTKNKILLKKIDALESRLAEYEEALPQDIQDKINKPKRRPQVRIQKKKKVRVVESEDEDDVDDDDDEEILRREMKGSLLD